MEPAIKERKTGCPIHKSQRYRDAKTRARGTKLSCDDLRFWPVMPYHKMKKNGKKTKMSLQNLSLAHFN